MTAQAQVSQVHPVNQAEWSGQLSSAAGRGADFALLLALQLGSGVPATSIHSLSDENKADDAVLMRLNHYRRPALDCSRVQPDTLSKTATILDQQGIADARLWQCMHPDPHALINDSKKLSADIIANCALATQQARASSKPAPLEEDPTQLDDIIEGSRTLLAS